MTQQPLISVVVPVYNRAELVIETLDSIAAQTYRPIEVVVVDDGSLDESLAVIEAWAQVQRKPGCDIRVVAKPNGGESSARNAGIEVASGSYLSFLDSDDLFHPAMLEKLVDAIQRSGCSFAYCQTGRLSLNDGVDVLIGRPLAPYPNCIPEHNWHVSAFLIEREALSKAGGFDERLVRCADWEMASRVKAFSGDGIYVQEVLTTYRIHEGPQLVKEGGPYPSARELALNLVFGVVDRIPTTGFRLRLQCASMMVKNALRYRGFSDLAGYRRCLKTAASWTPFPYGLARCGMSVLAQFYRGAQIIGLAGRD